MAELTDWQQRVVAEKADLDERLNKLNVFIGSGKINEIAAIDLQDLLVQQSLMTELSQVLDRRISRFLEVKT